MSFENRVAVDLFVKLSPFIDVTADNHVLTDQPQHEESIPDLCLKLRGVREVLRIEVKWIEQPLAANVTLTKKQIRSWQDPPTLANRTPHLWVAHRASTGRFLLLTHDQMRPILAEAIARIGPKDPDEDRYCRVKLTGRELTEPEFWREFWRAVSSERFCTSEPSLTG